MEPLHTYHHDIEEINNVLANKFIRESCIKTLHINITTSYVEKDNGECYDCINRLLRFIFDSCPLLEDLMLNREIYPGRQPGCLDVSLTNHTRLKSVCMRVDGFQYYELGFWGTKKWSYCYSDGTCKECKSDSKPPDPIHINLLCKRQTEFQLGHL